MEIFLNITLSNGAHGQLIIDTSTTPITGIFTPLGEGPINAVPCIVPTWDTGPNGATVWRFTLDSADGDFPIKANGQSFTYRFTGNENSSGTNPSGNVNFPDPNLKGDFEETVTWQSEATQPVEESQAYGQGAS